MSDIFTRAKRAFDAIFADLPDTARGRWLNWVYMAWFDHAVLRGPWTNRMEIAPGVWRGNHPTPRGWRWLKARGIKTVLNLRAVSRKPFYQEEERICAELGFRLISVAMSARAAPHRESLLEVMAAFRSAEKPIFFHCKSGADRSGLAAALYLLEIEKRSAAEARAMLSRRFVHLRHSKAGILDAFLDAFLASGQDLETWLESGYDRVQLQADFDAARQKRRFAETLGIIWRG